MEKLFLFFTIGSITGYLIVRKIWEDALEHLREMQEEHPEEWFV